MTGTIINKIVGGARFDREAYLWMLWNDRAGGDAVIIVLVTQALLTLGLVGFNVTNLLRLFISGLFFWLIYAGIAWAAGKFLFEGSGNFGGVLRISGFAFPTLLLVLAFDFILGDARLAYLASLIWFVAIVAHGMKEALELPIEKGALSAMAGVLGYLVVNSVLAGI